MQTAAHLSNRAPHAALNNGTPYTALYGKGTYLGNLWAVGARAFVNVETHTKKLEHRAWEGRLVGCNIDSKPFRVYNPETRRVRESQNVIFIETPSVLPRPDLRDFDGGGFTYDDYDDMVRDVRNYTVNQENSTPFPNLAVADPSVQQTTPPVDSPPDTAPGGEGPAPPGAVSPPEPGGGSQPSGSSPSGAAPSGSTPSSTAPSGPAPSGPVSRGNSARGGSARGGSTSRGGRGLRAGSTPTQPATKSVTRASNVKTLSELRRLAYVRRLAYALNTKGEFPDVVESVRRNNLTTGCSEDVSGSHEDARC